MVGLRGYAGKDQEATDETCDHSPTCSGRFLPRHLQRHLFPVPHGVNSLRVVGPEARPVVASGEAAHVVRVLPVLVTGPDARSFALLVRCRLLLASDSHQRLVPWQFWMVTE